MTTLLVIRHGQSVANLEDKFAGFSDFDLTDLGRKQAECAASYIKERYKVDAVYASDLQRAMNTAEIAIPGCVYETDPALREVNVGDIAGKPLAIVREGCSVPKNIDGYADFGGESFADMDVRVGKFMTQLETLDCENVAIFSHAGWLRSSLDFVMGMKMPKKHICCKNCAIAVYEYTGTMWRLYSWINL